MNSRPFPCHQEAIAWAQAPVARVFAYLDDPMALSAHMAKPSLMMLGSRMTMDVDDAGGRAIGSKIRVHGRMLGIGLSLEEAIVERQVPFSKAWQTLGTPRLLVIGHYRMGFELTPEGDATRVRVFIDYSLPTGSPGAWLGRWLGGFYARWCTRRMAGDVAAHFMHGATSIREMSHHHSSLQRSPHASRTDTPARDRVGNDVGTGGFRP